jgi:hypothetical protein
MAGICLRRTESLAHLPTRHARSAWLPDHSAHPNNRRRHGLAICRELGDQDGETAALTNLGITLEQPGRAGRRAAGRRLYPGLRQAF